MNRSRMLQGVLSQPLKFPYPTDGLVSYWTLDEDPVIDGVSIEDTVGINNGVFTSEIDKTTNRSVDGKVGSAINFIRGNGDKMTTDIIDVPQFTILFWIYPRNISQNQYIFGDFSGSGTSQKIMRFDVGYLDFFINTSSGITLLTRQDAPIINTWHHISASFSDGVGRLHINAIETGSGTAGPIVSPTNNTVISGRPSELGNNLEGLMDDVLLYNRALTLEEIQQIYNFGA